MSLIMLASCAPAAAQGGGGGESGWPDFVADYGARWAPELPTEPSGLTPVTVSSAAEWHSAMTTGDREITVEAGSYGNIALRGINNRSIIQDGVTIDELSANSGTNVCHVKFEVARSASSVIKVLNFGNQYDAQTDDLLLDQIRVNNRAAGTTVETGMTFHGTRCAIRNSDIDSNTYAFYGDVGSVGACRNVTFWNTTFTGGYADDGPFGPQSIGRTTGFTRFTLARCRFVKLNAGLLVRFIGLSDIQFLYNQIESNTGSGNNAGCTIRRDSGGGAGAAIDADWGVVWEHNDVYNDSGGPIQFEDIVAGTDCLVAQNRTFSGTGWPSSTTHIINDGTNTQAANTSAPAWSYA